MNNRKVAVDSGGIFGEDMSHLFNDLDRANDEIDQEIAAHEEDEKVCDWSFVTRMLETMRLMNSSLELDVVLEHVIDSVLSVIGAQRGFVFLLNEEGDLEFKIARDASRKPLSIDQFVVSVSFLTRAIRTKQIVYVEDILSVPEYIPSQSVKRLALRCIICCPMFVHQSLVGVIYADGMKPLIGKSKIRKHLFQLFSAQAAEAIRNAQLYRQMRETNEQTGRVQESYVQAEKITAQDKMKTRIGHEMDPLLRALELHLIAAVEKAEKGRWPGGLEIVSRGIEDLQQFSQQLLSNPHLEINLESFQLNDQVRELIALIKPLFSFEIVEQYDPGITQAQLDRAQMQLVFYHLLRQFKAGARITIRTCRVDKSDIGQVLFSGEGARLKSEALTPGFGSGEGAGSMNMSLCQAIMKKHHGAFSAAGVGRGGVRFTLHLPLNE